MHSKKRDLFLFYQSGKTAKKVANIVNSLDFRFQSLDIVSFHPRFHPQGEVILIEFCSDLLVMNELISTSRLYSKYKDLLIIVLARSKDFAKCYNLDVDWVITEQLHKETFLYCINSLKSRQEKNNEYQARVIEYEKINQRIQKRFARLGESYKASHFTERKLNEKLAAQSLQHACLRSMSEEICFEWWLEIDSCQFTASASCYDLANDTVDNPIDAFWKERLHEDDVEIIIPAVLSIKNKSESYLSQECRMRLSTEKMQRVLINMQYINIGDEPKVLGVITPRQNERNLKENLSSLNDIDHVTGAYDRSWLLKNFDFVADKMGRFDEKSRGMLMFDFDNFRHINEIFGYFVGDVILKLACDRISNTIISEQRHLVRSNGDEFIIYLDQVDGPHECAELALELLSLFKQPFHYQGVDVRLTVSIGIATSPEQANDLGEMMINAGIAMKVSKQMGNNNFQFFNQIMHTQSTLRIELEQDLKKAIQGHELCVFYQAKHRAKTQEIVGMEALARWYSPEKGWIMPNDFIPLAEETGLITELDEEIFKIACKESKKWLDAGIMSGRVAINLSANQFRRRGLVESIEKMLFDTAFPAANLEIEITEAAIMDDNDTAIAAMHRLRRRGIHLSIDDFGTGYSSLSYLKNYPVNNIKLDMTFVRDISNSERSRCIVASIIAMAHQLGLEVIAEGVEYDEQLSILAAMGCDIVQGYYFSKPIAAKEFEQQLQLANTSHTYSANRKGDAGS